MALGSDSLGAGSCGVESAAAVELLVAAVPPPASKPAVMAVATAREIAFFIRFSS